MSVAFPAIDVQINFDGTTPNFIANLYRSLSEIGPRAVIPVPELDDLNRLAICRSEVPTKLATKPPCLNFKFRD